MASVIARKWLLKKNYEGTPKREDLEIIEEELPPLKDGEFLVEAQWITVDPYQRIVTGVGNVIKGGQVGKIIQSKNNDFAVGDLIFGYYGWSSHTICDGNPVGHIHGLRKLDPSNPVPPSTALGTGDAVPATAYFGFLDICQPKPGETLVVNAAAGAVGSAVGQIAKIKGLRVVGFTGSDEKVAYLKSLGFDAAYNYKTISTITDALKESCPNGVDCFFDNVGGEFFESVLGQMNTFGRVAICGAISQYNALELPKVHPVTTIILWKQLTVKGFIVTRWLDQWPDAFKEMTQWIQEGKLQYKELVFNGFDSIFDAFISLFKGANIGKVVVKV
ncbi:prostaglandin reductase 1-like [Gigantopelta aegis]|uniref:prostaglandin reductase 1-like n=1 Tax=Gigantopelta aegis TaxID=1735272 RepID=UPI001B8874FA|nr:prostaglandin reductase 1-like [Gigantopelta aegis]